jgi:hypothetical protein
LPLSARGHRGTGNADPVLGVLDARLHQSHTASHSRWRPLMLLSCLRPASRNSTPASEPTTVRITSDTRIRSPFDRLRTGFDRSGRVVSGGLIVVPKKFSLGGISDRGRGVLRLIVLGQRAALRLGVGTVKGGVTPSKRAAGALKGLPPHPVLSVPPGPPRNAFAVGPAPARRRATDATRRTDPAKGGQVLRCGARVYRSRRLWERPFRPRGPRGGRPATMWLRMSLQRPSSERREKRRFRTPRARGPTGRAVPGSVS